MDGSVFISKQDGIVIEIGDLLFGVKTKILNYNDIESILYSYEGDYKGWHLELFDAVKKQQHDYITDLCESNLKYDLKSEMKYYYLIIKSSLHYEDTQKFSEISKFFHSVTSTTRINIVPILYRDMSCDLNSNYHTIFINKGTFSDMLQVLAKEMEELISSDKSNNFEKVLFCPK